ncbi:MAG: hypothetical protein O7D30_04555, partial [Rickettsia endosymbiont of Ixodes persulcatus]|nr:hypothetical protein [Rickettsia endosymbiont of Ixodes persulcatus]
MLENSFCNSDKTHLRTLAENYVSRVRQLYEFKFDLENRFHLQKANEEVEIYSLDSTQYCVDIGLKQKKEKNILCRNHFSLANICEEWDGSRHRLPYILYVTPFLVECQEGLSLIGYAGEVFLFIGHLKFEIKKKFQQNEICLI